MELNNFLEILEIEQEDEANFKEFLKAMKAKDQDKINQLLQKEGILVKEFGDIKESLLHVVAKQGTLELATQLCKLGSDVNMQNREGDTPISIAIKHSFEMVKLLAENGADVNILNKNNEGPLYQSIRQKLPEFILFFLKKGADLTSKNIYGMTPFLEVCRSGNIKLAKMLLQFGADFRAVDNRKNSALHYATVNNSVEIIEFLLKKGLDIEIKNEDECTPLLFATQDLGQKCLEAIECLVDHGADIHARSSLGFTALHIACYLEWWDATECLLELGFNYKIKFDLSPQAMSSWMISSRCYYHWQGPNQIVLMSSVALRENELGDYIDSYFQYYVNPEATRDQFEYLKLDLDKLKFIIIIKERNLSLYDFLICDFYTAVEISKSEEFHMILETENISGQFYGYGILINMRIKRIDNLKEYVKKTEDFLKCYRGFELPASVVRKILKNLSSKDFRIMGKVLSSQEKRTSPVKSIS